MRKHALAAVLALSAAICWAVPATAQQIRSYFSPNGGTANAIIAELNNAKMSIDVSAYALTHKGIAAALTAAHQRGVVCRLVIDPKVDNPKAKTLHAVALAGVQVRIDHHEKLHHNKYAIIDGILIITGSYNWSNDAETRNAENTVIFRDPTAAKAFEDDFAAHWSHSAPRATPPPALETRITPRATSPLHHPRPRAKEF